METFDRTKIEKMLEDVGLPYRYHHFTQKEMQSMSLPFIVWNVPNSDNFFADGKVYKKIKELDIELYTEKKDWELEDRLEEILTKYGFAWQQTASDWLPDPDSMWETLYEMEV